MNDDFIARTGKPFLAHRLKRLSDRLVAEIAAVLEGLDLTLPPTAGSTLALLALRPSLGVMEIASELNVTHPFIVRLVARLEQLGLVSVEPDPRDLRRKFVSLTAKGRSEAATLNRVNESLSELYGELFCESGADLLGCVESFEAALDEASFSDRLHHKLSIGDQRCVD